MDRLVDTFFGIDQDLLHDADQALAKQGISLSDAVVAFLKQVVREHGAPPEIAGSLSGRPRRLMPAEGAEFEEAVAGVAKGSVYTSAEIKAYLQQMDET